MPEAAHSHTTHRANVGLARSAGLLGTCLLSLALFGCANPGPPRPPSLHLPQAARDLTADRTGDRVTLTFTLPRRTTDDLPLRETSLGLRICRQPEHAACTPIPAPARVDLTAAAKHGMRFSVDDTLPTELATGPLRLLAYQVELLNAAGRSAGPSAHAYTAAGTAPARVDTLTVSGTRLGTLLTWQPAPGEAAPVLLERQQLNTPATARNTDVHFRVTGGATAAAEDRALDTAAQENVPYRYTAYRERTVNLAGHDIRLRSADTAPVTFNLRDIFPPPTPTELTAAAFTSDKGTYTVDLIWQPVDDPELAGYNVYREPLDGTAPRAKLNATPLPEPAFHDTTAAAGTAFRWSVTSLDKHGNESPAAVTTLQR
jgi:hypothetical protein